MPLLKLFTKAALSTILPSSVSLLESRITWTMAMAMIRRCRPGIGAVYVECCGSEDR